MNKRLVSKRTWLGERLLPERKMKKVVGLKPCYQRCSAAFWSNDFGRSFSGSESLLQLGGFTMKRFYQVQIFSAIVFMLLGSSFVAEASPYSLSYGGRLTNDTGAPIEGSINIEVKFFRSAGGADEVPVVVPEFTNILLNEGVFQLTVELPLNDFHTVFTAIDPVWIQIKDTVNNVTYPRQIFSAVPFALKIPTDNISMGYTSEGKLTLLSATNLQGRSVSNEAPGDGNILKWNGAESKWEPGSVSGAGTVTSVTAGASLETSPGAGITATGSIDIKDGGVTNAKIAAGAVSLVKIDASSCANGEVIKKSGLNWSCGTDLNSGSVTSVTASLPLSSSGGAAPNITINQANGSTNGFLTSSDWTTFNGKQAAGNYVTELTGEVTVSGPAGGGSAAATITNGAVIGKVLTGFTAGAGSVSASDTILSAVQKLDGNIAAKQDAITTLAVNKGGTGQATLTNGAILLGNGTSGISSTGPGTTGQIPISSGALITMASMSGDATLASTGALTIANTAVTDAKIASGITASKITEDATHRFATDTEKTTWNAKQDAYLSGGTASHPASGCPTGYIVVPGDAAYGTTDFCVMKYEAKSSAGGKGVESRATDVPLRYTITWANAVAACRNLGPGYALINNNEWMTIASNIANVASNWSDDSVGSGALNRGHTDGTPADALAASTDTDACSGTGQTCSDTVWDSQRRTHKLSNSADIWDFSGNVLEWVDTLVIENKPNAGIAYNELSAVTGTTAFPLTQLRPTNALKGWWFDSWNSSQGIGQYNPGNNAAAGGLLRGGCWDDGVNAGVFAAHLGSSLQVGNSREGFRCVFRKSP